MEKNDGNYKIEESIEIKGNPKDIKKLNDNEKTVFFVLSCRYCRLECGM